MWQLLGVRDSGELFIWTALRPPLNMKVQAGEVFKRHRFLCLESLLVSKSHRRPGRLIDSGSPFRPELPPYWGCDWKPDKRAASVVSFRPLVPFDVILSLSKCLQWATVNLPAPSVNSNKS